VWWVLVALRQASAQNLAALNAGQLTKKGTGSALH
jgi:hypothetical protein